MGQRCGLFQLLNRHSLRHKQRPGLPIILAASLRSLATGFGRISSVEALRNQFMVVTQELQINTIIFRPGFTSTPSFSTAAGAVPASFPFRSQHGVLVAEPRYDAGQNRSDQHQSLNYRY